MFFCSVLIRYLSQVFHFQSLCSRPILNYLRSFWVYSYLSSVHPPQLNISFRNVLLLLKIPLGNSADMKLSSTLKIISRPAPVKLSGQTFFCSTRLSCKFSSFPITFVKQVHLPRSPCTCGIRTVSLTSCPFQLNYLDVKSSNMYQLMFFFFLSPSCLKVYRYSLGNLRCNITF